MNVKAFFQRIWASIINAWDEGKIQRTSRITYDVFWNVILFFIIAGSTIAVFGVGTGAGYFASLVKDEPIRDYESMREDIYNYEETSKLYYADEEYIGDIRADIYREEVELDDISDYLVEAVVSTEDEHFYEHNGVVPKAIIRAMYQEVANTGSQTGGSTLTQQLIKNQILTDEVSFDRKAKEILLAMRLENFFEKDEIMEAYLNIVPYGRDASGKNIAGIQTASQGVFGEKPKDLNIAQAAFLAGIPQNPFAYTPFTADGEIKEEDGLALGKDRMKTVLKRMYKAKFITEEQYDEAMDYDITEDFTDKSVSPSEKHPAIVDELESRAKDILLEQIAEEDGLTMEDIEADEDIKEDYKEQADLALRKNGYHIHSTIDKDKYEAMQEVGNNYEQYGPDNPENDEIVEAGAVLMENNTGKILSFYPGRQYEVGENVYNKATKAHRPPGSTFKPLAAYAPAMDMGKLQPGSVIADIPTPSGKPGNYGGGYYGLVSAREALTHSYNVTAHYIYSDIIDENPRKNYLEKMGLHFEEEDAGPSVALGGLTKGVTVEENTSAFTTFANQGQYKDSYMIEKITDSNGDTIYEHEEDPVEVFSPQTSYLTIDMMRDVMKKGTAATLPGRLTHSGVDWAGKTGTSDDYKDAWFVGTNPNVTLGTWIGYNTPASIDNCPNCSLSYSQRNQALWANFVNALSDLDAETMAPQDKFEQPENIVSASYCGSSGMAPSDICSDAGLVQSDIYNSEYVPKKKDDSLIGGDKPTVEVDGKPVIASDKTPSEFTKSGKGGFTFNPDWLERKGYDRLDDLSQLIPRKNADAWDKISVTKGSSSDSDGEIEADNGENPPEPSALSNTDGTLNWNGADGHLIVGYRVFHASEKGGSTELIGHTTDRSYELPGNSGVYYVRAINYFGRESELSKELKVEESNKNKKEDKDKKENDSSKKDKDNDNKNSNNDNNNNGDEKENNN